MMQEKYKGPWIEALRSGKYKQGRRTLCWDNTYCCLGVLAEINGHLQKTPFINKSCYTCYDTLPSDLAMEFGINGVMYDLMDMNDNKKWTFNQIADWIEENL